jgi:hypothetical protein
MSIEADGPTLMEFTVRVSDYLAKEYPEVSMFMSSQEMSEHAGLLVNRVVLWHFTQGDSPQECCHSVASIVKDR